MTHVRNSLERVNRKTVVTDEEFQGILDRAQNIVNQFFRLRALALICLLRLTGKRRTEYATLEFDDFALEEDNLNVSFTLLKKRKEKILSKRVTKSIPLTDPLTKPIISYLGFLSEMDPPAKYFLPRVKATFGYYTIQSDQHISGRQVFNILRGLSETTWPHLYRETVASDVIKQDSSIYGAFKVQRRLDLESYQTGFNYLRRFAIDIIQREEEIFNIE